MLHLSELMPYVAGLFRRTARPSTLAKMYTLKMVNQGYMLVLEDGIEGANSSLLEDGFTIPEIFTPTVGCPAMINIGGENSIKKMWKWYLDAVPELYKMSIYNKNNLVFLDYVKRESAQVG